MSVPLFYITIKLHTMHNGENFLWRNRIWRELELNYKHNTVSLSFNFAIEGLVVEIGTVELIYMAKHMATLSSVDILYVDIEN